MSQLKIKVCGMRDTENIRSVAELKPDFMGFVFHRPSPRYVGDLPGERMFVSFPEDCIKTGVFVDSDMDTILLRVKIFGLHAVQLHGNETPETCYRLKERGIRVIKAFRMDDNTDFTLMEDYLSCTDYYLFDTATSVSGGSGIRFNWELLDKYQLDHPFFLSGGLGVEDAERILTMKNKALAGVDVNSRFETSPGVKDTDKLRNFMEAIRETKIT